MLLLATPCVVISYSSLKKLMPEGDQMEEMKEGLPEKLNHEITKGEESLTGTGKGRRFHGD